MSNSSSTGFEVSTANAILGKLVHRLPGFWIKIGNLETKILQDRIEQIPIQEPVFIAGLARSGTTILLELLSLLEQVGTHKYRDFPFLFTPYAWNWLVAQAPNRDTEPKERAHNDRIRVTPESPEAMEEPLWMAFFQNLHDPNRSNLLDSDARQESFDRFYADHIRKLLLIRGGTRYVSKGNYNVSRIAYLFSLFSDARFLIPIREPSAHIASLMKQHALFVENCKGNPRALEHLQQVGHFEFGMNIRPINMGNSAAVREIMDLWRHGETVRGWARYWSHIYGSLFDTLQANREIASSSYVVVYEEFCEAPAETAERILRHCDLTAEQAIITAFCKGVSAPGYYQASFTARELSIIREETEKVASLFGYETVC